MRDMGLYRPCDRCGAVTDTGTHIAEMWVCLGCTDELDDRLGDGWAKADPVSLQGLFQRKQAPDQGKQTDGR